MLLREGRRTTQGEDNRCALQDMGRSIIGSGYYKPVPFYKSKIGYRLPGFTDEQPCMPLLGDGGLFGRPGGKESKRERLLLLSLEIIAVFCCQNRSR